MRVLLADERPEEVTKWEREAAGAEIVAAPADQEPHDQVRAAELAIGHAKRRAEAGEDVVVIVDSLSRLALGYRDPNRVKRLFGAGRELAEEGSGSLTVIATVLDSDERGEQVRAALETTENAPDPPRRRPRLTRACSPPLTSRAPASRGRRSCARRPSWRRSGSCGRSSARWTRPRRPGRSRRADREAELLPS